MPMTIEMNMTEKSDRWPTTSVATPIDQHRLSASTTSITNGFAGRTKAIKSSSSVSAKPRMVACSLSRKAAVISSFESAGLPVTPTRTVGKSAWSSRTT